MTDEQKQTPEETPAPAPVKIGLAAEREQDIEDFMAILDGWIEDVKAGKVTTLVICGRIADEFESNHAGDATEALAAMAISQSQLISELRGDPPDIDEDDDDDEEYDE